MKDFFFDTANIEFIRNTWEAMSSKVPTTSVRGITTNPNAFFKVNLNTIDEWFTRTRLLCKLVTSIRGPGGYVHIQIPNSNMSPKQTIEYAKRISDLSDGSTYIGLKISPRKMHLQIVDQLNDIVQTNVTGLADHATALKCVTYGVNYISIIPGRMEEVGIDAKSVLSYMTQANLGKTEIITGSQRTFEQIVMAYQYDTVPTIGERVWPLILQPGNLEKLKDIQVKIDEVPFLAPLIDEKNIQLSNSFFDQMDVLGIIAYCDFE